MMKLSRRRTTAPVDRAGSPLGRELRRCATRRVTGRLTVSFERRSTGQPDGGGQGTAQIYLFEGGVYAVSVDGFDPRYRQRLATAQAGVAPAPEVLARTHQEVLLATLDVLLRLGADHVDQIDYVDGATTDIGCTLPIACSALLTVLDHRQSRAKEDLDALGLVDLDIDTASGLAVRRVGDSAAEIPEVGALLEQLDDSPVLLDEVAHACGFTRAEVLHLARLLSPHAVSVSLSSRAQPSSGLVPESLSA
jgi:hypothetical protein